MHSIVTTFRGADIKVEVANFCAAMDTLIDQDGHILALGIVKLISHFASLVCGHLQVLDEQEVGHVLWQTL